MEARLGDLLQASGDCAYAEGTNGILHVAHLQNYNTLIIDTFQNGHRISTRKFYGVTADDNLRSIVDLPWYS
jgi:hypothetical protein